MSKLQIKVKYFDKSVDKLEKIQKGNWIDLRSRETIRYHANESFYIPLNVAMELPKGWEAYIIPRSSTFKKLGLIQTNHFGLIDTLYCGDDDEWMMPVYSLREGKIEKGQRVCQFRIQEEMPELELNEVEVLGNVNRSGFGSTGTK